MTEDKGTKTSGKHPVLLMILDGWGYLPRKEGNAVFAANTPNLDNLLNKYPSTILQASGEAVGLPEGQMGNSEVGHLNIGAGRVVYQDFTKINKSIETSEIYKNKVLTDAIENVKQNNSKIHLMGLFSYGGVHSHMDHVHALVKMCADKGVDEIYIHAFLDGRDVSPYAGLDDIQKNEPVLQEKGNAKIATVSGRYYAMDRDKRWDRTKLAYDVLTLGNGLYAKDAVTAVRESYDRGETDEFVKPTVITDENGNPTATIDDNDSVIFFNFRPDRARQLTYSFVLDDFDGFERQKHPDVYFVCMTEYDKTLDVPIAYPPETIENTLGKVLSENNLTQLRTAETEKYAHVTFFLNGGIETQFEGEHRCLIPSPKVATYDLKPEMSAYEVTDDLVQRINSGDYDVLIVNYANMDMVGHTGDFDATVTAVEVVDDCVGRVIETLKRSGGRAFITGDHGNAEQMQEYDDGSKIHTAHTSNPVQCIYIDDNSDCELSGGCLCDIAPTILELLGIKKPGEMTGESLLNKCRD
ncbi:phosphoglycerate mutase, 2,3-bisphosphoglycerate-independent [Methanohalobium evestigatum Z-7303]|uniref:2,3-bisphosphoglycerate-independent phosphoglycerate mutase n=1 Tax=Methanohalobium evestigatum (strain ATCC BAA-1072 / DSM 3721 / NBRC 107634 / OCM 161 / Z-7303) TaxID=644295 RepID=D7EBE4_METEZ|nr:2,3-bisphosphoglycerate-independent phosphoglycerate mutase [Methanohalobium evestigatum]ADI74661.1 phosphoglycerate mutase, 2,3-bisphosphoglycerate-independent [Methanohalobium evestigatum Z-7303]